MNVRISPEGREFRHEQKFIDVDLSEAWDTESQADLFIESLKTAGLYNQKYVYSGFGDATKAAMKGDIFVASAESLSQSDESNPLEYALFDDNGNPRSGAIGIYDPDKLRHDGMTDPNEFHISDPSALIGVVKLRS